MTEILFTWMLSIKQTKPKSLIGHTKPLAIFCVCTAWFVSDLVGNPEDVTALKFRSLICVSPGKTERQVVGIFYDKAQMSLVMRKPVFSICENKDADQLRGKSQS